ncbi:hypothetical protein [Polaribacter sp. Hel_I_88]|uniref:hypothetical protein n=1 Tax=Polaribacter sp. Hel_I_88 TaxID=1250006 RepID=UPI00068F832C|nr:hypothetical protein [Polaribacter sp. Hel_I_88]
MFKQTALFLLLVVSFCAQTQNTYYFSNSTGNDTNTGNETSPFQTISKLNSLSLSPGDKILFKRGDVFTGQIVVSYSGSIDAPIVYDSYGTGNLPILQGSNGDNGVADPRSTIRIIGKEYLEFHNLHIENERFDTDGNASNDDKSYGIYFQSFLTLPASRNFEDRNLFKHFRFSNLRFQNIYSLGSANTSFNSIRTSGLHFFDAFVNDVIIENCFFTDIERTGVWLRRYGSDIVIRNNSFIDIGGSATILSQTKRVLYENNVMRFTGSKSDSRMVGRGSGMWVFASDDVVAQYNISQHSRGAGDSSGMHVDYGNTNILYQYNYLEDSAGGFCETLGDNDNIIWRYNISVNEGTEEGGGKNNLLWVNDYAGTNRKIKSKNIFIYNNTIYQGRDYKNVLGDSKILLVAEDISFLNNIIYLEPNAKLGIKDYEFNVGTSNFKNNLLYGGTISAAFKNLDATKLESNPQLSMPNLNHFSGYSIQSSSPVIAKAHRFTEPVFPLAGTGIFKEITSKATKDIFGNPVNLLENTNIGADNGEGTPAVNVATFEAESGNFEGGANEINCPNASGARAINFQDTGESLTFNTIDATESGDYLITVYYLNAVKSSLKIAVNNNEQETIILPASDAFCFQSGNPTSFSFVQKLNKGLNSIRFENGILDKIEILDVTKTTLSLASQLSNTKKELVYLNKTIFKSSDQIEIRYFDPNNVEKTKVSVYNTNGSLLFKEIFSDDSILFNAHKLGKGVKIITAEILGTIFVMKIIIY